MSNNLKVITVLLMVSLLSGCNETTGSGSQENTIQGNRQPNTTSVPTAKADNPSLSAGNAIRVARWSRDPKGGSLLAVLKGRLGIANNCLVMQDHQGAPPILLIFPYDSGVWDDAKRTFTYEGKVIRIGETIKVGGGSIQNPDSLKEYGKYELPDCGANHFFRVF